MGFLRVCPLGLVTGRRERKWEMAETGCDLTSSGGPDPFSLLTHTLCSEVHALGFPLSRHQQNPRGCQESNLCSCPNAAERMGTKSTPPPSKLLGPRDTV